MTDPGFDLAAFYADLPRKRLAAGALLRDSAGRVLLVEPTYKDVWELPGGTVEAGESPMAACRREVREELGIDVALGRLLCLDWHGDEPPRTEALLLVFDGGVLGADTAAAITLPADELRSYAFCTLVQAGQRLMPGLHRRIQACLAHPNETLYLENGVVPRTAAESGT